MKKLALLLAAVALWATSASSADAQVLYMSYYQPAVVYSPVVAAPAPAPCCRTSYYAPAPVAVAPVPAVTPVTSVRTRYRPILGGTVTRYRTGYAPAYYPAPVVYGY